MILSRTPGFYHHIGLRPTRPKACGSDRQQGRELYAPVPRRSMWALESALGPPRDVGPGAADQPERPNYNTPLICMFAFNMPGVAINSCQEICLCPY